MRSNSFGERLGGRVSEQKVARLWLENAVRLGWLDCLDGGRLRLLYPGRPGVGPGPDFRDAILLTPAGAVISGDVELHLEPKGWVRHGHHLDRNYNGVVLHVVLWPQGGSGSPKEALLQAGVRVPTTALFPVLQHLRGRAKATGEREPGVPISPPEAFLVSGLDQRDSGQLLDQAGDSRFLAKGAHWSRELSRAGLGEGAEELLYQALMEALGYSRNRSPFLAVAQGLPIAFLRRAFQGWSPAERALSLKALFLGSGGFADRFTSSLAHLRKRWASLGMLPLVELGSWDLFRCRPDNHPARRLAGMAALLDRFWVEGLMAGLTGRVASAGVAGVQEALLVHEGGRERVAMIGRQRAGEMAVNVLLPFSYAWFRRTGEIALAARALDLYRSWPALGQNEVTRESTRLLGLGGVAGKKPVMTARREQGLIHVYRRRVQQAASSGL